METQDKPKTVVVFEVHPQLLIDESRERKQPVYRDEIYLKVIHSKNSVIHRKMDPKDKDRWPEQWARFQLTDEYKAFMAEPEERPSFTPITVLDRIGPATKATLEAHRIRSVEDLAQADPDEISDVKAAETLIRRAQNYLTDSKAA